ncbi:LysR family transcriptional regulator [Paraburkholderia diazotrophica]|uniref:LysR family transcriptional regulator n=1 Tax=Paraburkholderia diazotrophica TaxID=667676 RepID=UPI00317C718C
MPGLRKKLPSANALFVFEAAARCRNFTRAAQELDVSQPAVSRMLARMEDHIGVRLFERVRGGIELTESGKILYRAISEGFDGIENAIREIEDRVTDVEPIMLSVSTGFATHWLMPRMSRVKQTFPHVDLRFQLIRGHSDVPLDDVDLGMRFLHDGEIDENAVFVMPETLLPVCNQRYLETVRTDASRVQGDTLIVTDDEQHDWHERFSAFFGNGRIAGTLSFTDYSSAVQAALLGQGIALGRLDVVSHWLAQGVLLPAAHEVIVTDWRCCLLTPANKPLRQIVANLRDWMIEETRTDMRVVAKKYPQLGLREAMKQTGLKFG